MSAAIRAELRKILTTRLWWVLLLAPGRLPGLHRAGDGVLVHRGPHRGGRATAPALGGVDAATATYSLVSSIGYVFPLVIGSLAVTTEFRHRTIAQTLLVEPRRGVVLGAKLVATVPVGLLFGVVGVTALVSARRRCWPGRATAPTSATPRCWRSWRWGSW